MILSEGLIGLSPVEHPDLEHQELEAFMAGLTVKQFVASLCQIRCIDDDREGNFNRIEEALRRSRESGVRLACFPETCILGWVNPNAHQTAHPVPGPDTDRLCKLARKNQVYISVGIAEKGEDCLYDSAVLISDTGQIVQKHRKINLLSELMSPPYCKGAGVSLTETPIGRICTLICADTFLDEILDEVSSMRPQIVLVPYGWAEKEEEWPEHGRKLQEVVVRTAKRTQAYVLGTDLVGKITNGPWKGRIYGGQSVAADPSGSILGIGKDRETDTVLVRIKLY